MLVSYEFWFVSIMMRSSHAWCPGNKPVWTNIYVLRLRCIMRLTARREFLVGGALKLLLRWFLKLLFLLVIEPFFYPLLNKYEPTMMAVWGFHSCSLNSICAAISVRFVAVAYSIVSFYQRTPLKILRRKGIRGQGSIYLNASHLGFPRVRSGSFLWSSCHVCHEVGKVTFQRRVTASGRFCMESLLLTD